MSDYTLDDLAGEGFYLVTYGGGALPSGPYGDVRDLCQAERLTDYPSAGYVMHYEPSAGVSTVPSLNPDDLYRAARTIYVAVWQDEGSGAAEWRPSPADLDALDWPLDAQKRHVVTVPAGVSDAEVTDALDAFLGDYDLPEGWETRPVVHPAPTCRHCGRSVVLENGAWIDPEAPATPEDGDDHIWREACDASPLFSALHERL